MDGVHAGYSLPVYCQSSCAPKILGWPRSVVQRCLPADIDYNQVAWPATDRVCDEEALWVRQNMLLGERQDMDDIIAAIAKMQCYSDELQE